MYEIEMYLERVKKNKPHLNKIKTVVHKIVTWFK